jgi:hypothetical protein
MVRIDVIIFKLSIIINIIVGCSKIEIKWGLFSSFFASATPISTMLIIIIVPISLAISRGDGDDHNWLNNFCGFNGGYTWSFFTWWLT